MNGNVMSTRYDKELISHFLRAFECFKGRGEKGFLRSK
jgi:hypothetical protein